MHGQRGMATASTELSADLERFVTGSAGEDADFAVDALRADADAKNVERAGRNRHGDFEANAVARDI